MNSQRRIYLDQAATSWPKLPAAVEAAEQFIRECGATSGRGAYASARAADQWVQRARHGLAQLLGGRDASDVAFCSSGTHALNATISGLLRPGDTVLTTAIEHNSVLRPLERWRKEHGIQLMVAPCDATGLVTLPSETMDPPPRIIFLSHGSNVTGRLQDLSQWSGLARRHNAIFVVDASQSLGYVPINMQASGIDVLVSAGHKGLGALSGTGLIVARPELNKLFQPLMWGGTGTASEQLDHQPLWPQSIEVGNLNLPAIVSMAVAAEHWFTKPDSIDAWRPVLKNFTDALRSRLANDSLQIIAHEQSEDYLPVISLLPSQWDVHDAAAVLDANFGIEVRAGFHCAALVHQYVGSLGRGGTLRFSLGHATELDDCDEAVEALIAMLS